MSHIESVEVCRRTGATYRQLDHWVKQGWIKPAVAHTRHSQEVNRRSVDPVATGSGYVRGYDEAEVRVVDQMVRLTRIGIRASKAAQVARDISLVGQAVVGGLVIRPDTSAERVA